MSKQDNMENKEQENSETVDYAKMFEQERSEKKRLAADLAQTKSKLREWEEQHEAKRLEGLSEIEKATERAKRLEEENNTLKSQFTSLQSSIKRRELLDKAIQAQGPSFNVDRNKVNRWLDKMNFSDDDLESEINEFVETFKEPVKNGNRPIQGQPQTEIKNTSEVPYKENVYAYTTQEMRYLLKNEPERYNKIKELQLKR